MAASDDGALVPHEGGSEEPVDSQELLGWNVVCYYVLPDCNIHAQTR